MRTGGLGARRRMLALGTASIIAGTILPGVTSAFGEEIPTCDKSLPLYKTPVRLGTGTGYEPGIRIDSKGTIFYTAHAVFPFGAGLWEASENRSASWLYRSTDDGQTWQVMEGGLAAENKLMPALEGDIAIDGKDRMYFVDLWVGDNHISRWSNHGATMDFVRPLVLSAEGDDRPWITAHGDGYVYYMSNSVYKPDGRLVIHRSTDGGQVFDPIGFTLPRSGWGTLEADPNSPYVYALANNEFYTGSLPLSGDSTEINIWISPDRGASWKQVRVAELESGDNSSHVDYPVVAVSPKDGSVYALFADGAAMKLAHSTDRGDTWTIEDVTPFGGSYDSGTLAVSATGEVAIGFHRNSFIYVKFWRPGSNCLKEPGNLSSVCTGPASVTTKVGTDASPDQEHFFQIRFSPDGAINVPYENNPGHNKFVRQASGPNMTGAPICGHVTKA